MSNSFASTESASGLLKDDYGTPLSNALKKKREKLAGTKLGIQGEDENADNEEKEGV